MSEIAEISGLVQSMHKELRKLAEIVHEGNGREPLMSRIAVMERQLSQIEAKLEQAQVHRWQVLMALVSGVVGFCVSVGTYLISSNR